MGVRYEDTCCLGSVIWVGYHARQHAVINPIPTVKNDKEQRKQQPRVFIYVIHILDLRHFTFNVFSPLPQINPHPLITGAGAEAGGSAVSRHRLRLGGAAVVSVIVVRVAVILFQHVVRLVSADVWVLEVITDVGIIRSNLRQLNLTFIIQLNNRFNLYHNV